MAVAERDDDEVGGGGLIPSDAPAGDGEPKKVTIDLAEADDEAVAADEKRDEQQQRPIRHKSQWRQMNEKHSGEVAELRKQIQALEGRVSQPREREVVREAPARQETGDAREREVQQVWRMQQRTLAAIRSGQYPDAEVREMEDDWRQMDRRRRALEGEIDSPQRQVQQQGPVDETMLGGMMLRQKYPQIFAKESLSLAAKAEWKALVEQGRPDTYDTAEEACERVAARKGIGRKSPAPTDAEKARHAGVAGRAGATPNGASAQYTPTKYIMELARAYTSHLPEMTDEDRYKHWRRYVGKKENLVP